jgi:hypothetical protein
MVFIQTFPAALKRYLEFAQANAANPFPRTTGSHQPWLTNPK